MIQAQPVDGASAPVVARHVEPLEAVVPHDLHLVEGHRPEGIIDAVFPALGFGRVPVAAQVGQDHRVVFGQFADDLVPGDVRLRVAVDEQQRCPLAAAQHVDRGSAGLNRLPGEPGKEALVRLG